MWHWAFGMVSRNKTKLTEGTIPCQVCHTSVGELTRAKWYQKGRPLSIAGWKTNSTKCWMSSTAALFCCYVALKGGICYVTFWWHHTTYITGLGRLPTHQLMLRKWARHSPVCRSEWKWTVLLGGNMADVFPLSQSTQTNHLLHSVCMLDIRPSDRRLE